MSLRAVPRKSANDLTPPAAQVARFRRDLEALAGRPPGPDARLGVAVSGGADSLALLLLAAAAYPGCIAAATVDHGLRPESAEEAAAVAAVCTRIGVPHAVLRGDAPGLPPGNLQEQARALRYRLLADWAHEAALGGVAVAHQQDDVAETFLMRARRGAGVRGLAAMAAVRPLAPGGVPLLRPLLGWRRAELAAIVAEAGLAAVDDPSNRHPRFDRSRLRALLADSAELPPPRLALAAANLRHAEAALEWAADREWAARGEAGAAGVRIDCAGLPYELRRRLVARAVRAVRTAAGIESPWREAGVDRLVALLDSGRGATLAGVAASIRGDGWRFRPAPPHRSL